MSVDAPQLEAPEPVDASWEIAEGRDAEHRRLLILLFGSRAPKQPEPGNG
ncbi:hypothetical protein ABZT17_25145 [Streptomyces sp. NPDC005648]